MILYYYNKAIINQSVTHLPFFYLFIYSRHSSVTPPLMHFLLALCRAATASTRWTRAGRRRTPSSTTTSATPPTTTRGGGSRRACPVRRPTATRRPSRWWSRSPARTRRPSPLCPRCCPRAPPPRRCSRASRSRRVSREPCSGRRGAGLPPLRCCPRSPPASTAPCTGPPAAWAAQRSSRLPPLASPLLFDPPPPSPCSRTPRMSPSFSSFLSVFGC